MVTVTPYERTGSFTSMPYPGIEPSTFGVAVGSPMHYTSWSAICRSIPLKKKFHSQNKSCCVFFKELPFQQKAQCTTIIIHLMKSVKQCVGLSKTEWLIEIKVFIANYFSDDLCGPIHDYAYTS